jgi:hypothetical protein
MNGEYKRIWKDTVMACMKKLNLIYIWLENRIDENIRFFSRDFNRVSPEYKSDTLSHG